MKHTHVVLALAALLAGCADYSSFVKDELKIPYVYIPPNNADHPFSLLMFEEDSNFQLVCPATLLTGLDEPELLELRRESSIPTLDTGKNRKASFDVDLDGDALGEYGADYRRIRKVELAFEQGRLYTMPDIRISDVVNGIANSACLDDVVIYARSMPKARFYIPTSLYGYDVSYRILTEDGANITAELPEEVTKLVLGKIGVDTAGSGSTQMSGEGLYIGFRGAPMDYGLLGLREQVAAMAYQPSPPGSAPMASAPMASAPELSPEEPLPDVIDVSAVINELLEKTAE